MYSVLLTSVGEKQQLFSPSSLATLSPSLVGRSATTTLAPFRVNLCAVALPKPEAPPVTRQIILCREAIIDFTRLQNSSLRSHQSSFLPLTPVLSLAHLNKRHQRRAKPIGGHSY